VHLAQGRDQWKVFVTTVMNLRVFSITCIFLSISGLTRSICHISESSGKELELNIVRKVPRVFTVHNFKYWCVFFQSLEANAEGSIPNNAATILSRQEFHPN